MQYLVKKNMYKIYGVLRMKLALYIEAQKLVFHYYLYHTETMVTLQSLTESQMSYPLNIRSFGARKLNQIGFFSHRTT